MKKGPFKMKGYSYPGTSPAKNKDSELVQDSTKQQGYQITGSGIQTFKSVERLKEAGAPKDVIDKELRVMDLTAMTLCKENNLPVIVFNIGEEDSLTNIFECKPEGSIISDKEIQW